MNIIYNCFCCDKIHTTSVSICRFYYILHDIFHCKDCDYSNENRDKIEDHIKKNHKNTEYFYTCLNCI